MANHAVIVQAGSGASSVDQAMIGPHQLRLTGSVFASGPAGYVTMSPHGVLARRRDAVHRQVGFSLAVGMSRTPSPLAVAGHLEGQITSESLGLW